MGTIRLSGFSDEIDANFDRQLAVVRGLGLRFIEIRGVDGRGIDTLSLEETKEVKQKLDAAGVGISSVGSPIGKIKITDDFAPHFERFQHVVEQAKLLGTRNIRMFSFFIPQDEAPEQYHDEVFRRFAQFADYAKEQDVVLLHENEKEIYGDNAPRCLELMERFGGAHVRAVFDFANFIQCGQETMEAYELLKPYISYIHIKDARLADGIVVPPGQGDGRLEEILGLLKQADYSGFLSIEPHLTDFSGLQKLENREGKETKPSADGAEMFTLAKTSLDQLLNRLDWSAE